MDIHVDQLLNLFAGSRFASVKAFSLECTKEVFHDCIIIRASPSVDTSGFFNRGLTKAEECAIVYLFNKYTIAQRRRGVDIIISSNTNMPIYEQITSQIKAMIMSGTLNTGDPIPSMRALAKSLHVSVITVQKAYEDLQRDGFIETTVGRGSFVSARNRDFYQEEQQRLAEAHLEEAAGIGRQSGIPLEKLVELLTLFYQEGP